MQKKHILALLLAAVGLIAVTVLSIYDSDRPSTLDAASGLEENEDLDSNKKFFRHEIGEGYVCNDYTPAVYYLSYADEDSPNTDKWIIEFVGGGSCGSQEACDERWDSRPQDMTTVEEEILEFDEEGGLLSSDPNQNPHFYDWNRVRAHYCTSDSWMGQTEAFGYSFTGAINAFAMLDKLGQDPVFTSANTILFNGVSVGGTGILNLADAFDEYVESVNPQSERFYISDCGWTLQKWMCMGDDCSDASTIGLYQHHDPFLNAGCEDAGLGAKCYYPEEMFHYIQVRDRFAVAQQMYDSQMMPWAGIRKVAAWDDDTIEWCYERTEALIESYEEQGLTNVFTSNCRTHDFTEHQTVYDTTIQGRGMADYLIDWIDSNGQTTFFEIDDDHYPEANPTCDTDLLG